MPDVFLRAATVEDQPAIRRMIRAARLYPFSLHWQRFVVAQSGDQVIGVGQVKVLGDGTPELASLAVLPEYQNSGIGNGIVWTLIDCTRGPIYLRCASHNEGYYLRFGFRTLAAEEMPRSLRRVYQFGNAFLPLVNWVTGGHERLLVMGRQESIR
jgi:N-acetylglutamate synthase-like GNAT family acetyltransferase